MEEKAEFDRIEELLESKMEYWSFSGLLHKVYRGTESVQKRLSDKLSEYDGEKNRAAVERKVRNWLQCETDLKKLFSFLRNVPVVKPVPYFPFHSRPVLFSVIF